MKILIKQVIVKDTYSLRKEILRNNIDKSIKFERDEAPSTIHIAAFMENTIIGIVSILKISNDQLHSCSQYQLRGMAIAEKFQHKGIGAKLVEQTFEILKSKSVEYLWCNSRVTAVSFYAKQGFLVLGKGFDIPLIGLHFTMYKELE